MLVELNTGMVVPSQKYVLIFNGVNHLFKKSDDLEVGDVVCVKRDFKFSTSDEDIGYEFVKTSRRATTMNDVFIPNKYSPDLGEWLGYIIANGSMSTNFISMSSKPCAKTENYIELVKRLFDLDVKERKDSRECKNYTIYSVKVCGFLHYICGGFTTARYKAIPSGVFNSTKETQRKFLRALFDCDASQNGSGFEYSSASEELIRGVQQLLLRFGIVSMLKRMFVKAYPDHTYWKLHIYGEDQDTLYESILFDSFKYLPVEKKKRNTNLNVVYGALDKLIRGVNDVRKTLGVSAAGTYLNRGHEINRFKAGKTLITINSNNISYSMLKRVRDDFISSPNDQLEILQDLIQYVDNILTNNFFYAPVKQVVKGSIDFTFHEMLVTSIGEGDLNV